MIETGVVMSEKSDEPGTTMPLSLGEHLLSSLTESVFQSIDALNKKLHREISKLIFGSSTREFAVLGLWWKSS